MCFRTQFYGICSKSAMQILVLCDFDIMHKLDTIEGYCLCISVIFLSGLTEEKCVILKFELRHTEKAVL